MNIARGELGALTVANSVIVKHRYHQDPRLSANQLAEYLKATAPSRKRILQEAKFPATVIVIRYEDAKAPVVGFMTGAASALENGIVRARRKAGTDGLTDYGKKNCELCIDAMESFQAAIANLDMGKTKFKKPEIHNTKLKISGVNISVSINMMTEETRRDGKRSIGAAILVFSKGRPNQREMATRCKAIALLIYELLKSQGNTAATCDPSLCMAIDVFNARIYRAMTAQVRLLRTMETSCEEVTNVWPSIKPPTNYSGPTIQMIA